MIRDIPCREKRDPDTPLLSECHRMNEANCMVSALSFVTAVPDRFPGAWPAYAGPDSSITPLRGALVGLVMGIFPTLGDLGESMIKRQVGAKDSGNILPGHGGAFDRVDSWLWAAVMGYYMIFWLWR